MMDIREIMKRLPHRYPFLLVDRILEMGEERIVAIKCVTYNEPFFQHKLVYFVAIDEVRFRRPVVPGDVLRLELELIRFGGRIIKMRGTARVGEEVACEGVFTATIIDREGKG